MKIALRVAGPKTICDFKERSMKRFKTVLCVAAAMGLGLSMTGCEKKSEPAKAADKAAEKAGEAASKAKEAMPK